MYSYIDFFIKYHMQRYNCISQQFRWLRYLIYALHLFIQYIIIIIITIKNYILINYDSTFNLVKVRLVSILFM